MGLNEHQGIYSEPMKKHRPLFTRREMLKVGAIGGLTLSQYLRAQAASGKKSSQRFSSLKHGLLCILSNKLLVKQYAFTLF